MFFELHEKAHLADVASDIFAQPTYYLLPAPISKKQKRYVISAGLELFKMLGMHLNRQY